MNTIFTVLRAVGLVGAIAAFAVAQVAAHRHRKRVARRADLVIVACLSFQVGATLALLSGDAR